jgi:ADP-ribose pyrophosphatase YjhB (NUDIX family)
MFIVALVLVQMDGKTLLIQEAKPLYRGRWHLPGGRLESGELLAEAAVREVREEAGIEVRLTGLLCIDQLKADASGTPNRLRFVFKAEPAGGVLKTFADEHSLQARWCERSQIASLDLRGPLVERALALIDAGAPLLPLSSLQLVTAAERKSELG